MKKIILSVIISLSFINSFAFHYVGEFRGGSEYNSSKLTKALIEIMGKDSVLRLWEEEHRVICVIQLDFHSRLQKVKSCQIRVDNIGYNDTVFKYQFELYELIHRDIFLHNYNLAFDLGVPISHFYIFNNFGNLCLFVFPMFMMAPKNYNVLKKEYQAKGKELSKYEYLLMCIQKYENVDDFKFDPWNQENHFLR